MTKILQNQKVVFDSFPKTSFLEQFTEPCKFFETLDYSSCEWCHNVRDGYSNSSQDIITSYLHI